MAFIIEEASPPTITTPTTTEWCIVADLQPSDSARYKEIVTELTIDAVEFQVIEYAYNENPNGIGASCSFTLADCTERVSITRNSVVNFRIGKVVSAVTTWEKTMNAQRVASFSYNELERTYSLETVSGLADKFNLAPETDLMIYDPDRSPFDATQVESLFDTSGVEYAVEDFPIEDLDLEQLNDEIWVNRCGFTSVVCTYPNFIIKQRSFPMGASYWESFRDIFPSLAPPVVEEIGGVLYILDPTAALPSGFPAPPELTLTGTINYTLNGNYSTADAVRMTFQDALWDYTENDISVSNEVTTADTDGFTYNTNIITNHWVYKHSSRPNAVVKRELQAEFRDTYRNPGLDHFKETILTNTFDEYGRISRVTRVNNELVPDLENEGDEVWQENVTTEILNAEYGQHPYRMDAQYQKKLSRILTGLTVEDATNTYLGSTFKQSFRDAHRAGNLNSDQTYAANKTLRTFTEKFSPTRDGQIKRDFDGFDNVRGVEMDYLSEPRTGAAELDGNNSKQQTLIVLPADGDTKGDGTFIDLDIKEMPLDDGIPLARRVLKKLTEYPATFTGTQVGAVDFRVRRGWIFEAKDVNNVSHGYFMVEGYAGQGSVNGGHTLQIQASQVAIIADTEIACYQITIASAGTKTFSRTIDCVDGYELTSETVADITVEARHSSGGAWTNIETGALDLSTWAGTTETFEIRLTAGTVTVKTIKHFNLIVAQP
jgi:hypothetical protein